MNLSSGCLILVIAVLAAIANADPIVTTNNGLAVWYDVRGDLSDILMPSAPWTVGTQVSRHNKKHCIADEISAGNAGGPGDGQYLFISPRLPLHPATGVGLHITGGLNKKGQLVNAVDHSVKSIYRYMTVESRSSVDEVISSLGIDTEVRTSPGNVFIEDIQVTINPDWWDETSATVVPDGAEWLIRTEATKDPYAAGPVFDGTGGAVPGSTYLIAEFVIAASQQAGADLGLHWLFDQVNDQLITRAYDGSGPAPELPDFGYGYDYGNLGDCRVLSGGNGGSPEPASMDGSTVGASSSIEDAQIHIIPKGNFDNDNFLSGADIAAFNIAISKRPSELSVRELYMGDFNNDGFVNGSDIAWFNIYLIEIP